MVSFYRAIASTGLATRVRTRSKEQRHSPTAKQLWSWLKVMKLRAAEDMAGVFLRDESLGRLLRAWLLPWRGGMRRTGSPTV